MNLHQKKIRGGGIWKLRKPPPRTIKYRCGEIAGTSTVFWVLADLYGDLLGGILAVGAGCNQRISSCFYWLYVNAQTVGWPHLAGLRLQGDGLGVSHAETNLRGFSAMDPGRGVEHLDGEVAAAELLDSSLVTFALLFCLCLLGLLLIGAI